MTRMLCVLGVSAMLMGCKVVSSPIYLHMQVDEMQRTIDERYCAGMSAEDVRAQLDTDTMTYFEDRDAMGRLVAIEARVEALGVQRASSPTFGRLLMGFHEDRLISIDYGHPVEDRAGRWAYSQYRLTDCDATGLPAGAPADAAPEPEVEAESEAVE